MRLLKKTLFASIIIPILIFVHSLRAQQSVALEQIRVDWHMAAFAEAVGQFAEARDYFQKVAKEADYLPLTMREWYRGLGYLGAARSDSRLGDTLNARQLLAKAFDHQFSNTALLESDTALVSIVGKAYLDSLGGFWQGIAVANEPAWLPEDPIILSPKTDSGSTLRPCIIALHGGIDNYRNFATYWSEAAAVSNAVIIIPPGILRNSETENSWGYDVDSIARAILALQKTAIATLNVDSSRCYLAGFSQGAQAAIAMTLRYPTLFRGAIAFSGFYYVPTDSSVLKSARSYAPRIYALSGDYDSPDFISHLRSLSDSCNSNGIPFRLDIEHEMVHEIPLDFKARFTEAWKWMTEHRAYSLEAVKK